MHAQRIAKKLALVASLAGCGGYDGEGVEGLPDEQESLTSRALEDAEEAGIAASNVTVLVNRAAGAAGAAAGDNSFLPSITYDGRFVAFQSNANNLSSDDDENVDENIFVRDLKNGTTTLVSRDDGINGAAADADCFDPSISADGRFVAFLSEADNLSGGDDDNFTNVFARDLKNKKTRLVSRADGQNGAGANDSSEDPSLSPDGRFVAFHTLARRQLQQHLRSPTLICDLAARADR